MGRQKRRAAGQAEPIILLIDGRCYLCHGITKFVIAHDKRQRFQFASLQSATGQHLLRQGGLNAHDLDTFVMVEDGNYYTKSSAALRVMRDLDGFWPLIYGLRWIPAFIRNAVYSFIAKRRYRWFGYSTQCLLPSVEIRQRFIDWAEVHDNEDQTEADLRGNRNSGADG
ncbi:thiol-disulfide oxidoreductase DCC family protein [Paenibacillus sp. GCM10027626]|uniref:thiol-disulfide oxidoreductase DCC family protein n=1 Tax=Paenibacillus sp. GCM10027626 TaxID=3273411 RepID=UPI0036372C2A